MKRLRRELDEKISAVSARLTKGQAPDYATYRELVGRLASLLEVREWLMEAAATAAGEDD